MKRLPLFIYAIAFTANAQAQNGVLVTSDYLSTQITTATTDSTTWAKAWKLGQYQPLVSLVDSTNWNKYNQWDGGSTGLTATTGRTSLGLGNMAMGDTVEFGGKYVLYSDSSSVSGTAKKFVTPTMLATKGVGTIIASDTTLIHNVVAGKVAYTDTSNLHYVTLAAKVKYTDTSALHYVTLAGKVKYTDTTAIHYVDIASKVKYTDTSALHYVTLAAKFKYSDTTNLHYARWFTCGTGTFSTTLRRIAISVPGTTTSSLFMVVPVSATDVVPTTNDIMSINAKTDSLIVLRPASGTSGMQFNWWRFKP